MKLQDLTPENWLIEQDCTDGRTRYTVRPANNPEASPIPIWQLIIQIFSASEFVQTAREMRNAQKGFFSEKNEVLKKGYLKESKNKEYKFDQLLSKITTQSQ